MINSITVTNDVGERIDIDLRNPEKSGFLITNISGIGAGDASINTSDIVTIDGSIFNSARLSSRNIVIEITFIHTQKESIEQIRKKSYKYFPIKKKIEIVFHTDTESLRTEGYIEKNDPEIFSEQEGTQISIICTDPYFYSETRGSQSFQSVTPLFRFPFRGGIYREIQSEILDSSKNPILDTYSDPLVGSGYILENKIQFGRIELDRFRILTYEGYNEIGLDIRFHFIGPVTEPTLYNVTTNQKMTIHTEQLKIITGSGIIFGDDIILSTIKGKKSIKLLRNGVYTNIFNCLDKGTDWLTIVRGDNTFYVGAESGVENVNIKINYDRSYEGV